MSTADVSAANTARQQRAAARRSTAATPGILPRHLSVPAQETENSRAPNEGYPSHTLAIEPNPGKPGWAVGDPLLQPSACRRCESASLQSLLLTRLHRSCCCSPKLRCRPFPRSGLHSLFRASHYTLIPTQATRSCFFFLLGAAAAAAATAASPAVSQLPNNVCSRGPSCSHEPLALPSNLPESRSIPLSEEERSPACIISGAALQGAVAVAAAAAAAIYSRRKKNRARCTTRLVFSLVPQARCRGKAKCTMQMRRMHRRSELAKKKIVQVRWNCTRLCPGASHSLDDAALPYQRCPLFLFFS